MLLQNISLNTSVLLFALENLIRLTGVVCLPLHNFLDHKGVLLFFLRHTVMMLHINPVQFSAPQKLDAIHRLSLITSYITKMWSTYYPLEEVSTSQRCDDIHSTHS